MPIVDYIRSRRNRIVIGSAAGVGLIFTALGTLWGTQSPLPVIRVETSDNERQLEISTYGAVGVGTGSNVWGSSGSYLASGGGSGQMLSWQDENRTVALIWYLDSGASTGTGQSAIYTMPFAMNVTNSYMYVKEAPEGSALIADMNEQLPSDPSSTWTTLFSTKPQVNANAYLQAGTHVISDTLIGSGSRVSMDIDQVGSTQQGTGITIMLVGTKRP